MQCFSYAKVRFVLVGVLFGTTGALIAYTLMDPNHVAWLILVACTGTPYTAHGLLPARNFRFWYTILIGSVAGASVGACQRHARPCTHRWAFAAGFLGRLVNPLGDFYVE
jgi:hypothetical protein